MDTVQDTRTAVAGALNDAFRRVQTIAQEADGLRANPDFSPEYKADKLAKLQQQANANAREHRERAARMTADARQRTAEASAALLQADDAAMAARAAMLDPVIKEASSNPEPALAMLAERGTDKATRALLVGVLDSATAVLKGRNDPAGVLLQGRVQKTLATLYTPEEQQVLQQAREADELAQYQQWGEGIISRDIRDLFGLDRPEVLSLDRTTALYRANAYEEKTLGRKVLGQ